MLSWRESGSRQAAMVATTAQAPIAVTMFFPSDTLRSEWRNREEACSPAPCESEILGTWAEELSARATAPKQRLEAGAESKNVVFGGSAAKTRNPGARWYT